MRTPWQKNRLLAPQETTGLEITLHHPPPMAEVKEAKAATTELQATCNIHKGHVVVLNFKPVLQAAVVC